MELIKVGDKLIGGDKTYIIADIGSNHMQDLTLAKESILAAVESGVDAVKFQSIQLEKLYLNPSKKTSDFIKKLEFPEFWHNELNDFCNKLNITFFSSPTYLDAIKLLEDIKVPIYKIASAQIGVFPQLVEKVASLNKPTLFSTGIVNENELDEVISVFYKYNNRSFVIMHCNSIYPTPAEKVNLTLLKQLSSKYPHPVGFSDHTIGTHTCCAAVAIGAKVIEKHFTLNREFNSPDSNEFASDPKELNQLVKQIRDLNQSLNSFSGRDKIEKEEQNFKEKISTKLILCKDVKKGDFLKRSDFKFLRSKSGIDCKELNYLVNSKAVYSSNIRKNTPLFMKQVKY